MQAFETLEQAWVLGPGKFSAVTFIDTLTCHTFKIDIVILSLNQSWPKYVKLICEKM